MEHLKSEASIINVADEKLQQQQQQNKHWTELWLKHEQKW